MKPQYQHAVEFIEEQAPIWQERMGLDHYHIEHIFLDSFDSEDPGDDYKTTAITECRWQYMQGKVKWFLPSMIRHDDNELETILVHEYTHILLGAEQTLVFDKAIDDAEGMSDRDADKLMERHSEQLEHSTEMAARAIMAGWLA